MTSSVDLAVQDGNFDQYVFVWHSSVIITVQTCPNKPIYVAFILMKHNCALLVICIRVLVFICEELVIYICISSFFSLQSGK